MSIAPGPMPNSGTSGIMFKMPTEVGRPDVWVYAKGKGHAVEAMMHGWVIEERDRTNEKFYGQKGLAAKEILSGRVQSPASESNELLRTLNVIQSESTDYGGLPQGKIPGDSSVQKTYEAHGSAEKGEIHWR